MYVKTGDCCLTLTLLTCLLQTWYLAFWCLHAINVIKDQWCLTGFTLAKFFVNLVSYIQLKRKLCTPFQGIP